MKKGICIALALLLLLTGCSSAKEQTMSAIREDLTLLTQSPRPIGSEAEQEAAEHLADRFAALGYQVELQEYASIDGMIGHNVIAKRGEGEDILVLSAHHDSFVTSFGANDNASGVTALLAVAKMLANTNTDTELRLISFTDEENGKNGSRAYLASLAEEERARMIGCIQFDMLGGLGGGETVICTTDGSENYLTELLMLNDQALTLGAESASDHASFALAGIPAVLVMQKERGYLYHTMGDTAEQLNQAAIYRAAKLVADAAKKILSPKTDSYRAIAKEQAADAIYRQNRQSRILFYASREENEAYLGIAGELIDTREEVGDGWSDVHETYAYKMGWFGLDEPMNTHYLYRNGYLEEVKIFPAESGYTAAEVEAAITATHCEAVSDEETGKNWQDELYGKFISLDELSGKPVVSVYSYSVGISNTLATYPVTDGEANIGDVQHQKVWELFCKAIPRQYRSRIVEFQLFTDGYSNILAYTAAMGEAGAQDNTCFCITIDYYDAFDENGQPRDQSKLLYTLVHEYGHVLLENETQIDLSRGEDLYDSAALVKGSFRKRYFDAFWRDSYQSYLGSYWEKPENYVSGYAGNMFHEDIADTFAVFVFGSKPTKNSVAEQKLRFFWEEQEMVTLRSEIRAGLGLE